MLNSVGLQGPGVATWREVELPVLVSAGATVVASIWGRTVADYERAAALLAGASGVVAVEVNVSCPNIEDRARMFAHSASATADAVAAAGAAGLPRWAKLSPNVADLCEIAGAALGAGAEGLTLVNTLLGMGVDVERRAVGLAGGLSGPALRPVAVRAVWECRRAFPAAGILGAGGVDNGAAAVELLMAGADAVQVGTAVFADPRAPWKVQDGLTRWCRSPWGSPGARVRSSRRLRDRLRPSVLRVVGARPFGERVVEAVGRTGPLCAGIDPSAALLSAWGLPDDSEGLAAFCERCVEAFAGVLPAVKLNRWPSSNATQCRRHGGARADSSSITPNRPGSSSWPTARSGGDIDSTAEAYADAWCRSTGGFGPDAVTVACYLGLGALTPMIRAARASGRGVFVVVRSTNPEGRMRRCARGADRRRGCGAGRALLDEVAALNRDEGLAVGSVCAVVGVIARAAPLPTSAACSSPPVSAPREPARLNVSATLPQGANRARCCRAHPAPLLAAGPTPRHRRIRPGRKG